jgi:transposase
MGGLRVVTADPGVPGRARRPPGRLVRRPDELHTLQVLPRRWVVERTLAWITRHRRTVRDYERLPTHHETYWAMIVVMTRRLARRSGAGQPATT